MRENKSIFAQQYVNWAEEDLELKDKTRGISYCWNNLKNAINTQVDLILTENNFFQEAKTWDILAKLQKVKDLGYTTPKSFTRLIKNRNYLIHRNVVPEDDPIPYVDVVKSFINDSGRKLNSERDQNKLLSEELLGSFSVLLEKENLSEHTIKIYIYRIKNFLKFVGKQPKDVKEHDLESYILFLRKSNLSESYQTISKSALLSFFNKILRKDFRIGIKIGKKPRVFKTLSIKEIENFFSQIKNLKDLLMAGLIYGSGLKTGNVINLRKNDINFNNKVNSIERTGRKSIFQKDKQLFLIPKSISKRLEEYSKDKKDYLFLDGKNARSQIRGVQHRIKYYGSQIGIAVNPVILRNSFEKHLQEKKVNDAIIQVLLGKYNILRMQGLQIPPKEEIEKIESPLDDVL